jgi:hypothetical protein
MPLLAYEMAHQLFLWFKAHPDKIEFIDASKHYEVCSEIIKDVCYPYWDFNRFQTGKPKYFRKDKDFWFYDHTEFSPLIDRWQHYYRNQFDNIDKKFLYLDPGGEPNAYRYIISPPYYLGNLI